jgi:hypothetical protein
MRCTFRLRLSTSSRHGDTTTAAAPIKKPARPAKSAVSMALTDAVIATRLVVEAKATLRSPAAYARYQNVRAAPLGAPGRPQQDEKHLHQTDDSNHAEADNPDLTKLASFRLKKKH